MAISFTPRILPGILHPSNQNACDWGWQGLLAYGCQNYVVVIDPKTVQVIQTVHHNSAAICMVKWTQENYYHDLHSPYQLILAAGNTVGSIMIYDIRTGVLMNELIESNRAPICMDWLKRHEVSNDLLLVLYSTNVLCLWNADTGVKLWRKVFQDNILSFTIDPFHGANMTVMSSDWIMLISDLSLSQTPSEKGRKFFMSTTNSPAPSMNSLNNSTSNVSVRVTSKSTFQKIKSLADDLRGKVEEDQETSCDCLKVTYLPSNRNHLLLLFPREILILDMAIGQVLGSFSIEASSPSFHSVVPCYQRDILYLLHDNGSISIRAIRSPTMVPYQDDDPDKVLSSRISLDIIYDIKCHSDVFRLSRGSRLMGFCVDAVYEKNSALILADGRVLFWTLEPPSGDDFLDNYKKNDTVLPNMDNFEEESSYCQQFSLDEIVPHLLTFGDDKEKRQFFKPRFMLDGIFEGVSQNPSCTRMCPPMTTKNFTYYKPLLAVGCNSGALQLLNAATGQLIKHFTIPCQSIKGIEWISLTTLLVYINGSSSNAKGEILHVDVTSGFVKVLPSSRGLKESVIALLKVSHLKQYFLVLFKNHTVELWDAINLCQLREFPSNFPKITAFEWSPSSYGSKFGKKKANLLPETPKTEDVPLIRTDSGGPEKKKKTKEHLVFTDSEGTVYHYVVEGTSLRDGSKVPPEVGMGVVSYITWKKDVLVLGDVDGNMNLWDLKGKVSRVFNTHRGPIKRIKFAPGKGNMKIILLFNDGVEVWDPTTAKVLATIKTTKDQISITDVDWLSSALPILLVSDGSIRILDATLKSANCPIEAKDFEDKIFNPRLLDLSSSLKLKHFLQHQKWRDQYDPTQFSNEKHGRIIQDVLNHIPRDVVDMLSNCALGTAERCLKVSQLFGDESDWVFWKVALHYLLRERNRKLCPKHKNGDETLSNRQKLLTQASSNSFDDFLYDSEDSENDLQTHQKTENELCKCAQNSLDTNFDVLCDNQYYKKCQLYRIALQDSHRSSYEHTRMCAEKLILTGEMDRAVQILLEGEPNDGNYYTDALRACLISAVKSSGASQSTIKLVATNLIASGKISEGVELLCLVDKGTDACRYLQTYSQWELATWLAKVRLSYSESSDVVGRWCAQLCTSLNKKVDAILILLSFGKFQKVLETMFSLGHTDRAVLFIEACLEFDAISLADEKNRNMYENIFLDYARLQIKLNNQKAAEYYCGLAGGRGKKLLEELL